MSKIEEAKGRRDGNSGYGRVLGNGALGDLISRVQATVISNGTELEKILASKCRQIEDIDAFIDDVTAAKKEDGTYICLKRVFKKSLKYAPKQSPFGKHIEPDMLIFLVQAYRVCKVLEIKDGDMFDTKKAEAEQQNLEWFSKEFGSKIPFSTDYYICSFNQPDKTRIREGFKNVFDIDHIMTGLELCTLLHLDYDEIISAREADAKDNFNYFINQLVAIPEVRQALSKTLTPS